MVLFKSVMFMASARVASLGCAAALNVLVTRALGPEGRGLYALPTIDCGLAATLLLGLASAVSYFMLNKNADRGIVRATLVATACFLLAGAVLTLSTGLLNRHLWALTPALVFLPFSALISLCSGYCIGRDRMRYWGYISVAAQASVLLFVAAGFVFAGRTATVAIAGWLAGTALVALVATYFTFRHARGGAGETIDVRAFVVFGFKAGAVNVVTQLNYRVDVYIVAAIAPLATLGLYVVAVAGAEAAVALAHAFSLATQPRVGRLDAVEAANFTARCVRNNLLFASVLCLGVGLIAEPVVRLLFGARFEPIVPVLRVLLIGVVALSVGTVIANFFILNAGRAAVPLATGAFSAAICAGLSFWLVPRIGMLGAAIGTATAYIVSQFISVFWFCRTTGIAPARVLIVDAADLQLYKRVLMRKFGGA